MTRLVVIVVLLVATYASIGVGIYFSDLARHWCGYGSFYRNEAVFYALLWPLRFLSSGSLCN